MDWNVGALAERDLSRLLLNTVVPRPIALVTTHDAQGRVNAAPFSYFNVMSAHPPLVALGIDGNARAPDGMKDTTRNIVNSSEFVINLVDEPLVRSMNLCAIDFPPGVDETVAAGLALVASVQVAPPRVANSPVQFECRLHTLVPIAPVRYVILGEIVHIHVRDDLIDAEMHIDPDKLNLVGRLHGDGWYCRTTSRLREPRVSYASWQLKHKT
jgi:flavin reductase (DIM6/NTAB) family NADH-FMN oxidoreductase RutF